MSSSVICATAVATPDTARATLSGRRSYPQDPAVPGPNMAGESRARANVERIACDIVALNVYTLKALQDGWYQWPQFVNRGRCEELQGYLTAEEQEHVDWIAELSDHGFNAHVAEYVGTLSHADQLSRIMDPRPSCHYSDLFIVCLKRYRAAVAHVTLVSRTDTLDIPERYDYCKTYQDYVGQTVVEELETRHELAAALRRASSLLDSIRIAVDDGSVSNTCLSIMKTKLAALQEHYSEAHSALLNSSRDLFDPTSERWWESRPASAEVTEEPNLAAGPPLNAVAAYLETAASARATLEFVVPAVCLLCCIPVGYACFYSPPEPGTTTDSDFWQLVAGSVMQYLSLATLLWPGVVQSKLPRLSGVYTWLLASISAIAVLTSIVLFRFVSSRWSIVVSFAGNAAQVLILLQLMSAL